MAAMVAWGEICRSTNGTARWPCRSRGASLGHSPPFFYLFFSEKDLVSLLHAANRAPSCAFPAVFPCCRSTPFSLSSPLWWLSTRRPRSRAPPRVRFVFLAFFWVASLLLFLAYLLAPTPFTILSNSPFHWCSSVAGRYPDR